jgi:hypothetical protein
MLSLTGQYKNKSLIYKLYEFTYKEVKIVDAEFGMNEEDYEEITIK